MTGAIELKGVAAGYQRGRPVIKGIDLTVVEKDFLAVIGPNGGGKTTLLKVILGLLKPWSGEVRVMGRPPERAWHLMGYVPQVVPDQPFPVTVMDVVLMGRLRNARRPGRFGSEDRATALHYLNRLDIGDLAEHGMNSLSGGQMQRVLIARALAGDPEILLLDEPVASVDQETQESFFNMLSELNHRMTIILVTHDVGAISSHVKNIACINRLLVSHGSQLTRESIEQAYGCPFELVSHGGIPHRVLGRTEMSSE